MNSSHGRAQAEWSSGPPKTSKALRTIGIPSFLAEELATHIGALPSSSDVIFSLSQGGLLDYNRFRACYWIPVVIASLGPPCTPRDVRHTHFAILIAHGESPKHISDRLGHESTRTVFDVYGHLYDSVYDAATTRLNELRTRSRADQARTERRPAVIALRKREPKTQAT